MDFEKLGEEIAARMREAVGEAEERARRIIEDAEREAGEIRQRAESEARERLAEVRGALDRLESSITGERAAVVAEARAEIEQDVEVEPAPDDEERESPDAAGVAQTEPLEGTAPVDGDEDEDLPEAEVTGEGGIDEAGARLVAMEMALDGEDVEAIATRLTEEFGLVDAHDLATEVHSRATP